MDYKDFFNSSVAGPIIKEQSTEPPAISAAIISWLREIYPLRRYNPFDQPIYNVTLDLGRWDVIDRLELEFKRQHESAV